ncbi:MAG: oxidoreductase [Tateyamaria sp.]|nr:oxidoreductase [Tateyamaria sp.]MDG1419443.1 oxidoreductase [Tateyamaria sp.]MDG1678790.1 oxidoreductase [Tateyamaria sp.]MDG2378720.1 oxidoreductase [Tateyamaria sp.]
MSDPNFSYLSRALVVFLIFVFSPVFAQDKGLLQVTLLKSDTVYLNLEALDMLEQTHFKTTTMWTSGKIQVSGVSLKTLLKHLGARGESIELTALDNYSIVMPIADLEDGAPIIVTHMNREIMSVRKNGPYWLVFPYDSDPKYQTEVTYGRSIWQLTELRVVN